jgi:hypothetical protein
MSEVHRFTGEPGHWEVILHEGATVRVRADAFWEDGDDYVFVVLMEGTPRYDFEVARIPKVAASEPNGG